jgi:hypothetical protein
MPIKVLLKMVPKRVWFALGAVWLGHLVIAGFSGAAIYAVVF